MGFGKIGRFARKVYRGADRIAGGYLPGGHRPNHEMLMDRGSDAFDMIGEGLNTAFDVFSGNRDRRFNRDEADKAYDRQRELIVDKAGLEMEGLAAAGINPSLAGSGFQGSAPGVQAASNSGSAAGLSGAINSAVSAVGAVTNVKRLMAEIPQMQANTRKVNADAAFVEASTPDNLKMLKFQLPGVEANTAKSIAERKRIDQETKKLTHQMPQFQAEADYYKRYGRGAVLAREMRNPWQSAQLMAHPVGDAIGSIPNNVDMDLNSAIDVGAESIRNSARQHANQFKRHHGRNAPISGQRYMFGR